MSQPDEVLLSAERSVGRPWTHEDIALVRQATADILELRARNAALEEVAEAAKEVPIMEFHPRWSPEQNDLAWKRGKRLRDALARLEGDSAGG